MNIGITYDLRSDYLKMGYGEEETAEFDRDDTITSIEKALHLLGHTTTKIGHVKNLINRLSEGEKWDLVFNIAEGLYGYSREATIPAILEAYKIPYTFSDPLMLSLCLHKGHTKIALKHFGIKTTDFSLIQNLDDMNRCQLNFPLFIKPVAEGTSKGVSSNSKIIDKSSFWIGCANLIEKYKQPVLVEEYLSGREFTVGIIGTGKDAFVVGVLEIILKENAESEVYSYANKENCEELVKYKIVNDEIAKKASQISLELWNAFELRDAGRVDLKCDHKGELHVIEVNPLAGLHPDHSDLPIICKGVGLKYEELIKKIVDSASKRILHG